MKKLLLPVILALSAPFVQAGDDTIGFSTSGGVSTQMGVGVLRSSGNLYRPAPRGGSVANLTPSERYRAKIYRPTQYFYTKDNVVSYRYSSENLDRVGNEYDNSYHGPHGAVFVPTQHQLATNARLRSYASVEKRAQPGVPMVPKTLKSRTVSNEPTTSLQVVRAN